jgi:site-specific recombinase XerD
MPKRRKSAAAPRRASRRRQSRPARAHSFASRLRENGADLQDMQEALGHSTITTTTMYAHLSTRRRREKLAEYLK